MFPEENDVVGVDLNRSGRANLCDYSGLDCLTVTNGTTDTQRFFAALSHRASAMLSFADEAALIGAAAIAPAERGCWGQA